MSMRWGGGWRGEAKRENLWAHMLGPLNAPIQSKAVCEVSESKSDSETSIMASDWIGVFKGPSAPRGSPHISPLLLMLVHEREKL